MNKGGNASFRPLHRAEAFLFNIKRRFILNKNISREVYAAIKKFYRSAVLRRHAKWVSLPKIEGRRARTKEKFAAETAAFIAAILFTAHFIIR